MKHRFRVLAALAAICIAPSCTDSLAPIVTNIARFQVGGGELVVTNIGEAKLYSLIADKAVLPLLDWVPCVDPQTCQGIAPGAFKFIDLEDIIGYQSGGEEAIAYHWYLVSSSSSPTGFKPDSIRATTIRLK